MVLSLDRKPENSGFENLHSFSEAKHGKQTKSIGSNMTLLKNQDSFVKNLETPERTPKERAKNRLKGD